MSASVQLTDRLDQLREQHAEKVPVYMCCRRPFARSVCLDLGEAVLKRLMSEEAADDSGRGTDYNVREKDQDGQR